MDRSVLLGLAKAHTLKPCPFVCQVSRGPHIEVDDEEWDIARVCCGDCGSAGPFVDLADYGGDEKVAVAEAVRRWNLRGEQP